VHEAGAKPGIIDVKTARDAGGAALKAESQSSEEQVDTEDSAGHALHQRSGSDEVADRVAELEKAGVLPIELLEGTREAPCKPQIGHELGEKAPSGQVEALAAVMADGAPGFPLQDGALQINCRS